MKYIVVIEGISIQDSVYKILELDEKQFEEFRENYNTFFKVFNKVAENKDEYFHHCDLVSIINYRGTIEGFTEKDMEQVLDFWDYYVPEGVADEETHTINSAKFIEISDNAKFEYL
jgi:hypothetical protein